MAILYWRSTYKTVKVVDGVLGVTTTRAYGCDDKQHRLCSEKIYLSNPSYHIGLAGSNILSFLWERLCMLLVWLIIPVLIWRWPLLQESFFEVPL